MGIPERPGTETTARTTRPRAAAGLALAIAILVFGVPLFANYGDAWAVLRDFDRRWLIPLLIVGALNLVAPATSQSAALPGLGVGQAVRSDWATSAVVNTTPLGSALAIGLTWSMYRSWGHEPGPIGRSIVTTGIWDLLFKLLTPLAALAWLATEQPIDGPLRQAAIIAALLFVAGLVVGGALLGHDASAEAVASKVGGIVSRIPRLPDDVGQRLIDARSQTIGLIRQRWLALSLTTIAGHLNLALLLGICLRGVGVDSSALSAAAIFAAFTFGRLVTAIPITPGGLGVLEVGLIGALGVVGSALDAQLVAAVLLLRVLTLVVPIPLGLLTYLHWARGAPTGRF